jgi:hypothetical protein
MTAHLCIGLLCGSPLCIFGVAHGRLRLRPAPHLHEVPFHESTPDMRQPQMRQKGTNGLGFSLEAMTFGSVVSGSLLDVVIRRVLHR